jgi:LTXXQ motif family protein
MNAKWICVAIGGSMAVLPALTDPVAAKPIVLTQMFPALHGVHLTPGQETQLQRLTVQTLPQIKSGLSPAQLIEFEAALQAGTPVRVALADLDLSVAQQLKLTREFSAVRVKLSQILTTKQQQQVIQNASAIQTKKLIGN